MKTHLMNAFPKKTGDRIREILVNADNVDNVTVL